MVALQHDWRLWARPAQLPPDIAWRVWVLLGGRGAGKTRAAAEWTRAHALARPAARIALLGASHHEVREVMIEGASGIMALGGPRPDYQVSRRRLVWPNGAQAFAFSAEDPDAIRGPQFDAAWADEFCAWAKPGEALATLQPALRLGPNPRLLVTTTPRPIKALKALLAQPDVVVTRSPTRDNAANLAPGFVAHMEGLWGRSAFGRQELEGDLIEDREGALWRIATLDACRIAAAPPLDRIVVAVDPPASVGPDADACGIIAAGRCGDGPARRGVVLADATIQGASPKSWAERAARLAEDLGASAIIAEANQGGEMVRAVFAAAGAQTPVRLVRAVAGKRARAEPIAALYEHGRIAHLRRLDALEDEMLGFGAQGGGPSPDRVDALVWALSELMFASRNPRLTWL
jgi:phage terminase large subunit-like protein